MATYMIYLSKYKILKVFGCDMDTELDRYFAAVVDWSGHSFRSTTALRNRGLPDRKDILIHFLSQHFYAQSISFLKVEYNVFFPCSTRKTINSQIFVWTHVLIWIKRFITQKNILLIKGKIEIYPLIHSPMVLTKVLVLSQNYESAI